MTKQGLLGLIFSLRRLPSWSLYWIQPFGGGSQTVSLDCLEVLPHDLAPRAAVICSL
jgi:hypothetical protein